MSQVECAEFLSRFSDFYDGSPDAPFRQALEAHLEHCEKCARYERAVASGAALLRALPRIEPSESFRPALEHRLFHLEDENALTRAAGSSAVPVLTAVGIAIVLAIIAWAPTLGHSTPQVALAPIVVTGRPSPEPVVPLVTGGLAPFGPVLDLTKELWSDPNALLYEYSPMREGYQTESSVRQADF
jgi:hypothetical protein